MNVNLGLGLTNTTIIMGIAFIIVLFLQFKEKKCVPGLYWLTVVLISVFGTLVTDNLTDGMGVPLEISTIVFSVLLGLTFLLWYLNEKTLSIHSIFTRKREAFYWLTILFTFALGTAVGDLYSEQLGLGYLLTGIAVIVIITCAFLAWKFFKLDSILAFWFVYIFTRPLGASLGDYLSQPKQYGGLGLGATVTSVIFLVAILAVIIYLAITKCDTIPQSEVPTSKRTIASRKSVLAQTVIVLFIFLSVSIAGYVLLSHNISSQADTTQTTLNGQLGDFISIESDMIDAVNVGDFTSAKTSADNLEHEWDTSAPTLKKIDKTTWTQIDGTIDAVLAAVRSKNPDAGKCTSVLDDSLRMFESASTPLPPIETQAEAVPAAS